MTVCSSRVVIFSMQKETGSSGFSKGELEYNDCKHGTVALDLFGDPDYRFENGAEKDGNKLIWNVEKLYANIIAGIKECNKLGVTPYSVGIDTWGVDYALLDENNEIIGEVYSYRDSRTSDMTEKSQELVSFSELYERTGIQHAVFNTVYQLYADKLSGKLQKAKKFLTVPDYMHYRLSGVMVNEYTDASTTALVNAKTRNWDYELIEKYGFPSSFP